MNIVFLNFFYHLILFFDSQSCRVFFYKWNFNRYIKYGNIAVFNFSKGYIRFDYTDNHRLFCRVFFLWKFAGWIGYIWLRFVSIFTIWRLFDMMRINILLFWFDSAWINFSHYEILFNIRGFESNFYNRYIYIFRKKNHSFLFIIIFCKI